MIQPLVSLAAHAAFERLGEMQGQTAGVAGAAHVQTSLQAQAAEQKSFDQVLSGFADVTVSKLQTAETLSVRKMSGEDVAIRDVVSSIMEAEQALNTAVAIRDKIVQSYLEISRMQI